MMKRYAAGLGLLLAAQLMAGEVLIVADEFPAMKFVASRIEQLDRRCQVVGQDALPAALTHYEAVLVYIHKNLAASVEEALIRYTEGGGRLVVLHHSISSGKRTNDHWFKFLGVDLSKGDVDRGGYKWIEDVSLEVVNLARTHYLTTNKVRWEGTTDYTSTSAKAEASPSFHLDGTEVYLNHILTEPHTLLLGFRYRDAKTGKIWMQDRAGWLRPGGKGWIVYLQPGHSVTDFQNPVYQQILLNALTYKP